MYQGSLLRDAQIRVNDPTYKHIKEYKCIICHDSGWIAKLEDGRELPSSNPNTVGKSTGYRICQCLSHKQAMDSLERTGLKLEEYSKNTLETFDSSTEMASKMKEMAMTFLADQEANGIGYFGQSGIGKTHICIAICHELSKRGLPHKYFSYRNEIDELKALTYEPELYRKKMDPFLITPVLFIDDLFKLAMTNKGNIDVNEIRIIFDLINTRYLNNRKVVLSSEYTVAEIKDIDEALGSRIYQMIKPYGMKCEGKNRRI